MNSYDSNSSNFGQQELHDSSSQSEYEDELSLDEESSPGSVDQGEESSTNHEEESDCSSSTSEMYSEASSTKNARKMREELNNQNDSHSSSEASSEVIEFEIDTNFKTQNNEDIIESENHRFCNTQGFFTQESMELVLDIEEDTTIKTKSSEQTPKKSNLNSDKVKDNNKHQTNDKAKGSSDENLTDKSQSTVKEYPNEAGILDTSKVENPSPNQVTPAKNASSQQSEKSVIYVKTNLKKSTKNNNLKIEEEERLSSNDNENNEVDQSKNNSSQQSNDSSIIVLESQLKKKVESSKFRYENDQTCSSKSSNQTYVRSFSDAKIIQKIKRTKSQTSIQKITKKKPRTKTPKNNKTLSQCGFTRKDNREYEFEETVYNIENSQDSKPMYKSPFTGKNLTDICKDCNNTLENCKEKQLGKYLIKAMKRHYKNNVGNVSLKECHDTYSLLYNVIIDHSKFEADKKVFDNLNNLPPMCMRTNSLLYCLKWTKWNNDQLKNP